MYVKYFEKENSKFSRVDIAQHSNMGNHLKLYFFHIIVKT